MQIEHLHVSTLIPYINNAREHSKEQINQIAASIKEFGFNNAILVDENLGIIAGHGRVMAAKKLGIDKVPCVRLKHLTETQKKAFIIADNKLADNSEFNKITLIEEIQKLAITDIDLSILGFKDMEILPMIDSNVVLDPMAEWKNMPDYNQEKLHPKKSLLVHFETEHDFEQFFILIGRKHTDKTKFIWWPEQEEFTTKDKEYQQAD